MKKLKLTKILKPNALNNDELTRIKGGACRMWLCDCSNPNLDNGAVESTLEERNEQGYI